MTITVPIIPGRQLIDAAPLPLGVTGPTTWASAGAVQAWDLLKAADDAYQHMLTDVQEYLGSLFPAWLKNYESGVIPFNAVPPSPPPKYQAMIDPSGLSAWDLVAVPNSQACPIPPYSQVQAPVPDPLKGQNALQVLQAELGNSAGGPSLFTKATPVLGNVTAPDGSVWVRMS